MVRKEFHLVLLFFLGGLMLLLSCDDVVIKKEKVKTDDLKTLRPLPAGHKQFIIKIYPKIANANLEIEIKREGIKRLRSRYHDVVEQQQRLIWLKEIAADHKFEDSLFSRTMSEQEYHLKIDTLLTRVDIIPENLVLAQAIVESGWGKSKFAKEVNNYFGIRCFTRGCGVKPSASSDSTFWVKKFPSIEACIEEYLRILNTVNMYDNMRKARISLRQANDFPNGIELSKRLKKYSESGSQYTNLLTSIIKNYIPNNLEAFVKYQGSAKIPEEVIFE
jgi:Bax protein